MAFGPRSIIPFALQRAHVFLVEDYAGPIVLVVSLDPCRRRPCLRRAIRTLMFPIDGAPRNREHIDSNVAVMQRKSKSESKRQASFYTYVHLRIHIPSSVFSTGQWG